MNYRKVIVLFIILLSYISTGPVLAAKFKRISIIGTGKTIGPAPDYFDPNGVTIKYEGVIQEIYISGRISRRSSIKENSDDQATFSGEAFINITKDAIPSGREGICFPVNGIVTITDPDGNTLTMKKVGLECTLCSMVKGEIFPQTVNGTYYIIDGTGKFAGAEGTGGYTLAIVNESQLIYELRGIIGW